MEKHTLSVFGLYFMYTLTQVLKIYTLNIYSPILNGKVKYFLYLLNWFGLPDSNATKKLYASSLGTEVKALKNKYLKVTK